MSMTEQEARAAVELILDAYDSIKAINWSTLKHIGVSPRYYRYRLKHPEDKAAFKLGGAGHCALFEPHLFDSRYAVYDGTHDARHKAFQAWKTEHPGVQALKQHEYDRAWRIAEAVREHPVARRLLAGGRCEEIVTWSDASTGLACKGRFDYLRPDFVVDLKTAREVVPHRFQRAANDYGYIGQVVFYHDGAVAERLIDGSEAPYIVAIGNDEDHDVVAFQLDPGAVEYGRALYRSYLQRLLECTEAGYWPGVAPELQTLEVVPWAPEPIAINAPEDF